jgi:hypothetical protein
MAKKVAVSFDQLADAIGFQVFLFFVLEREDDFGASFGAIGVANFKLGRTITRPMNCCCALFVGEGIDFDLACHHEGRVEAQTEVPDDLAIATVFIFLDEFFGAGEGDLVDVLLHLVGGHADAVVCDRELFVVFVDRNLDFGFS